MLFNLEAIMSKEMGSFYIHANRLGDSKHFNVKLDCKYGELKSEDKSLVTAITKILATYKVLEENQVTIEKGVPF